MAFAQSSDFRIDSSQFYNTSNNTTNIANSNNSNTTNTTNSNNSYATYNVNSNNCYTTYNIDGSKLNNQHEPVTPSPYMKALFQRCAISATHESSLATYAPRCKPGTRVEVIGDIIAWARHPPESPDSKILWFSGPAGGGKTCIQREVACQLQQGSNPGKDPPLAASYFFSNRAARIEGSEKATCLPASHSNPSSTRGTGVLDSVDPFVPTIAYQLVMSIPGLMEHVEKAIKDDPLVFEKGLDIQAKKLISAPLVAWKAAQSPPHSVSEPSNKPSDPSSPHKIPEPSAPKKEPARRKGFKRWAAGILRRNKQSGEEKISEDTLAIPPAPQSFHETKKSYPNTVTIDGWDEITNVDERKQLLNIIRDLATHDTVPLRFILASRPEHDIREKFGSPHFQSITRHLKLENYNGDDDIQAYLCDEFERIRLSHPAKTSIPHNWPPEEDIDLLNYKASGQFIYPSAVIKFVDNPRRHPMDLLKQVLNQNASSQEREGVAQPLAELYSLYDIIFRPPDVNRLLLKQVLHSIHGLSRNYSRWNQDCGFYDSLFSLQMGTTSIILCDLHSLIDVTSHDIEYHHKTAVDYLLDPHASHDLYQSIYETDAHLAESCIFQLEYFSAQAERDRLRTDVPSHVMYATAWWDNYTGRALQNRPISLPRGLATFDPHISFTHNYLYGSVFYIGEEIQDQMDSVHEALVRVLHYHNEVDVLTHQPYGKCTDGKCILFCKRIQHAYKVEKRVKTIVHNAEQSKTFRGMTPLQRSGTQGYQDLLKLIEMDQSVSDWIPLLKANELLSLEEVSETSLNTHEPSDDDDEDIH